MALERLNSRSSSRVIRCMSLARIPINVPNIAAIVSSSMPAVRMCPQVIVQSNTGPCPLTLMSAHPSWQHRQAIPGRVRAVAADIEKLVTVSRLQYEREKLAGIDAGRRTCGTRDLVAECLAAGDGEM